MVRIDAPDLDRIFGALGDPTRRAMLTTLTAGEASVSDLGAPHGMTLAGAAKHVRVLAEAGLISHEKVGRTRICRLNPEALRSAAGWIAQYERFWAENLDALDRVLEDMDDGDGKPAHRGSQTDGAADPPLQPPKGTRVSRLDRTGAGYPVVWRRRRRP